ncbi:type VI secretion-associated protein, BMA_A0400 family [Xanthomonas citri pv. citri]|nr:type VI secretion-associated protein, BMA_A0400 family [Xanthomonas citri pv. citri]
MPAHEPLGFHGKLPGVGDFVQRRLPASFVQTWDLHFANCLDTVRQPLGQHWPGAYRNSGLRAFALGPGVCGATRRGPPCSARAKTAWGAVFR